MSLSAIVILAMILLALAYRFYGRYISQKLGIDDANTTPAHSRRDNVDYMPGRMPVVFGHHFASIAGAGPIVGPIIAVSFGWIPALVWILVGGVFFGAVHDITSMVASIRHQGKSIGEVIERYIGVSGKQLFMIFAFFTLILVIAVFMDIVARTFVSVPSAASASLLFMVLALVFGVFLKRGLISFWLLSVVGVTVMYSMVYAGTLWPLELSYTTWIVILAAYCFAAAIAPVWMLLQPRDYLNAYLLYGMMLFGILGIFVANPTVTMTASVQMSTEQLGTLFPVLFVTIACGAISGFHSLVASGTTSKQLDRETDARRVGFGGMLVESLLAVIAVGTVVVMSRETYEQNLAAFGPVTVYSQGLGGFMSSLGIEPGLAVSFVALAVSAFAVTTLDTCTRLGRFIVQEYTQGSARRPAQILAGNRSLATLVVVILSVSLLLTGQFEELWPIFGSANQLLAALALLAGTVWLHKCGIKPIFTLVPMVFMFAVTLSSLLLFAWKHINEQSWVLALLASFLFVLAVALIMLARRSLRQMLQTG